MLVLACLEWLGVSVVDFGDTGVAWSYKSLFWLDWNDLEWRK
jgi:hypothetical protein